MTTTSAPPRLDRADAVFFSPLIGSVFMKDTLANCNAALQAIANISYEDCQTPTEQYGVWLLLNSVISALEFEIRSPSHDQQK